MSRDPRLYLEDIIETMEKMRGFVAGMTRTELEADDKTAFAVMRGFQIIGEAARCVPETIRAAYSEVPWSLMIGMRNRVTHDYLGIDYAIAWRTIHTDFPTVLPDLRRALRELSP